MELGDINNWKFFDEIEVPDLLLAGFPCQSYSVAGRRLGLDDFRGQLMYPMLQIVKYFQPTYAMFENVKGFLSINNGRIFRFFLQELNSCGYAVDWRLINSALVSAQNRERLYVFAKRLDTCKDIVYDYDIRESNDDKTKKNNRRNDVAVQ